MKFFKKSHLQHQNQLSHPPPPPFPWELFFCAANDPFYQYSKMPWELLWWLQHTAGCRYFLVVEPPPGSTNITTVSPAIYLGDILHTIYIYMCVYYYNSPNVRLHIYPHIYEQGRGVAKIDLISPFYQVFDNKEEK